MHALLALLLIFILAAVGVWDVIMLHRGTTGGTVSRILVEWSMAWPILPLTVGIILGHLFWPASR